MDYLSIREDATIEASRMQRAAWDAYMEKVEGPKTLAAGQRVSLEGVEHVVQTARNWAKLRGYDPERAMASFRRHEGLLALVWLVPMPRTASEAEWEMARALYGGPIPPAGSMETLLPECLWVGDRFEVEGMAGLVYLDRTGPAVLVR